MPIELALLDGETAVGSIDAISSTSVALERADGSVLGNFANADITAFALLDEALDRSNEMCPLE